MLVLATLAIVSFFVLRWAVSALERAGRLGEVTASRRSAVTDLGYLVIGPATEILVRTGTAFAVAACALLVGERVGPGILHGFGPVMRQPRWAILLEMLLLSDFTYYWTHRAAHTLPFLWRFHAVHHSTKHLRWSSALRAHPAEAYVHFVNVIPLFLFGFPIDAFFELSPIITFYALFIHANSNFAVRRLAWIMNSPRNHAWHHALDITDGTKNFSGFFPLFDAIFGTYKLPDHRPDALGMDDEAMPETCLEQIVHPFAARADGAEPDGERDLDGTKAPSWAGSHG